MSSEKGKRPSGALLVFLLTGAIPILAMTALTARIVWERTVLTAERGPQNVGFALFHGSMGALVLAPFALALWLVLAIGVMLVQLSRRGDFDAWLGGGIAISVVLYVLLLLG